MKKWLLAALVALAVIVGGGVWFWSMGSIPTQEKTLGIVLRVESPTVEIRSGEAGEWRAVTGDVSVSPRDEIRTGQDGRASLRFFDASVTRLQGGTTVIVEEAIHANDRMETAVVRLRMTTGRVWSRVMTLFDLGSSFAVHTDNVVATVRGTAFDLGRSASGTTVWVSDSAVQMADEPSSKPSPGGKGSFFMGEGHMATRQMNGTWSAIEPMKSEDMSSAWFTKNMADDRTFEAEVRTAIAADFKQKGNPRVGSVLERVVKASERLHLKFAGDNAAAMYESYLGRRLFAIQTLIDEGKSGLAFQALTPIEADIVAMLKTPDAETYRPAARRVIRRVTVLLGDVSPSSPHYRFLQRLEDLTELVSGDDQAMRLYSRLMGIDARLSTTARLIDSQALEEAGMSLDAAHQGMLNVANDLDATASDMRSAEAEALRSKRDAMSAREDALRDRLDAALAPPPPITSPTSTTMTPTSTPAVPSSTGTPSNTSTTPTPPVGTIDGPFDRITVSAQPSPVTVGSIAQLRVTGIKANGSTVDLTTKASFRLIGGLGSLNGPTYTATQSGSVTIEASVVDGTSTKTATTVVQVNQAVTLSRIDITTPKGTAVQSGTQSALVVTATYTSGLTANVTYKVTWQTSDASIGSALGSMFTASPNGNGTVTITATYTEGGVTKTNTIVFAVSSLR